MKTGAYRAVGGLPGTHLRVRFVNLSFGRWSLILAKTFFWSQCSPKSRPNSVDCPCDSLFLVKPLNDSQKTNWRWVLPSVDLLCSSTGAFIRDGVSCASTWYLVIGLSQALCQSFIWILHSQMLFLSAYFLRLWFHHQSFSHQHSWHLYLVNTLFRGHSN